MNVKQSSQLLGWLHGFFPAIEAIECNITKKQVQLVLNQ